jgi:putative endonuclease
VKDFYVYVMSNRNRAVLYTGITKDLARRVWQHKNQVVKGFTSKYKLDRLVYYEQFADPISAITREKEIKAWRREKKNDLVRKLNPSRKTSRRVIWRKCLRAPPVIPNRADVEGPHQYGVDHAS